MYIEKKSREKLHKDVSAFIPAARSNLKGPRARKNKGTQRKGAKAQETQGLSLRALRLSELRHHLAG